VRVADGLGVSLEEPEYLLQDAGESQTYEGRNATVFQTAAYSSKAHRDPRRALVVASARPTQEVDADSCAEVGQT